MHTHTVRPTIHGGPKIHHVRCMLRKVLIWPYLVSLWLYLLTSNITSSSQVA